MANYIERGISSAAPALEEPGTFHPPIYAPFNGRGGRELSPPVDNRNGPERKVLAAARGSRIFPVVVGHGSERRNWRMLLIRSPASPNSEDPAKQSSAGRAEAGGQRQVERRGIR